METDNTVLYASSAMLRLQAWLDKNTRKEWTMAQLWAADGAEGGVYYVSLSGTGVRGETLAQAVHDAVSLEAQNAAEAAQREAALAEQERIEVEALQAQKAALDAEQAALRKAAARSASAFWNEYLCRTDDRDDERAMPLTQQERLDALYGLAKEWAAEGALDADELPV